MGGGTISEDGTTITWSSSTSWHQCRESTSNIFIEGDTITWPFHQAVYRGQLKGRRLFWSNGDVWEQVQDMQSALSNADLCSLMYLLDVTLNKLHHAVRKQRGSVPEAFNSGDALRFARRLGHWDKAGKGHRIPGI